MRAINLGRFIRASSLSVAICVVVAFPTQVPAQTLTVTGARENVNPLTPPGGRCVPPYFNTVNIAPGALSSTGTSNISNFTSTQSHCILSQPPTPLEDGRFTYTFEAGDTIFGTYTGDVTNSGMPGIFNAVENLTDHRRHRSLHRRERLDQQCRHLAFRPRADRHLPGSDQRQPHGDQRDRQRKLRHRARHAKRRDRGLFDGGRRLLLRARRPIDGPRLVRGGAWGRRDRARQRHLRIGRVVAGGRPEGDRVGSQFGRPRFIVHGFRPGSGGGGRQQPFHRPEFHHGGPGGEGAGCRVHGGRP